MEVLEGDRKSVIGVCRQDEAGSVYLFAANQGAEPVKVRFSSENGTKQCRVDGSGKGAADSGEKIRKIRELPSLWRALRAGG